MPKQNYGIYHSDPAKQNRMDELFDSIGAGSGNDIIRCNKKCIFFRGHMKRSQTEGNNAGTCTFEDGNLGVSADFSVCVRPGGPERG